MFVILVAFSRIGLMILFCQFLAACDIGQLCVVFAYILDEEMSIDVSRHMYLDTNVIENMFVTVVIDPL